MKRFGAVAVVLFLGLFVFAASSEARLLKNPLFKAKVVSVDVANSQVVVSNFNTGKDETYIAPPGVAATLQKGQIVIISHKVGSNVATMMKPPRSIYRK